MFLIFRIITVIAVLFTQELWAEQDLKSSVPLLPSRASLHYSLVENGSNETSVKVDKVLPLNYRFAVNYARTNVMMPALNTTLNAYGFHLSSSPLDRFYLGFGYQRWGNQGDMITETYSGHVEWSGERWVIKARPLIRVMNIFPLQETVLDVYSTYSRSLDTEVSLHFLDTVRLFVNALFIQYDQDFSDFDQGKAYRPIFKSHAAQHHEQGLARGRYGAGINYRQNKYSVTLEWRQLQSMISNNQFTHAAVFGHYELNREWKLHTHLGQSLDGQSTDLWYISGGLSYQWID